MARRGKARPKRAVTSIPVRSAIDGSELCLQCGLCCDGTLFRLAQLDEGEQALVESLGLAVEAKPEGGIGLPIPCPAFIDGCCSLYTVGRPEICGSYRCALLNSYEAGTRNLSELLPIVQLVHSLARELEVEMGIPTGGYTRNALIQYLNEVQPWTVEVEDGPPATGYTRSALFQYLTKTRSTASGAPVFPQEVVRFLVAFRRLYLLGEKYFGYEPLPVETETAAAGEQVAAGSVAGMG